MHIRALAAIVLLAALAVQAPTAQVAAPATYANPVLAGDHPDPSVVRVGREYWATATTSQWAPIFPLLRSPDLVNWTLTGAVFERAPEWSDGSYWAPEIAEWRGRYFVYYTARKKDGPLCIAAATAPRPQGPYTDHGPMECQEVGSIDAVAVTAEDHTRWMVWKEDGNSRKQPTPLWAQRLSEDGTRLVGDRHELFRNDAPWEGHLVEGPFILRRQGWFYMFYSAGACCGRQCDYRLGVARARRLLGPWEKHAANPILAGNDRWKCPGHGTIVTTPEGRTWLLYHAYEPDAFQFSGRQGLLDEVTWTRDGWPEVNGGRGPSTEAGAPLGIAEREPARALADEFATASLDPGWQWPWRTPPDRTLDGGMLTLVSRARDAGNAAGTIVARPTPTGDYVATARVVSGSLSAGATAGLAAYGNDEHAIGVSIAGDRAIVWQREKGVQTELASRARPSSDAVVLQMAASDGRRFRFAVSGDGRTFEPLGTEADGGHLPPWDLAVRVALTLGGPEGARAQFDWLRVEY
jgi:beta-xylosidase